MKKRTIWQRLFGTGDIEDEFDLQDEYEVLEYESDDDFEELEERRIDNEMQDEYYDSRARAMELKIDLYEQGDNLVLLAFVPGISLADMDVEISRDFIQIRASSNPNLFIDSDIDDTYEAELVWGDFERKVSLPEEIDVDSAEAFERNGVLKIIMPKFNKSRKRKLKVKSK